MLVDQQLRKAEVEQEWLDMRLANFAHEVLVADSFTDKPETAVQGLDAYEFLLFAVEHVQMGLGK